MLSLAIPLLGLAGTGAREHPCPMSTSTAQHAAPGHASDAPESAPCCDDAESMAAGGEHSPCKTGQDCGGGGLALLLPGGSLSWQALAPLLHPFQAHFLLEPVRSRVWRPPASR